MEPIKIAVYGALGKVGQEVVRAVCNRSDMELVGAVELAVAEDTLSLPDRLGTVPFSSDLDGIITSYLPDVLVDFTAAKAAMAAVRVAARRGVNLVIGTTGFTADEIAEIDGLAKTHQIGVVVAPNFALGAVLMMHLAKIVSKHFDCAEIIELHHQQKKDSPSGTALATARAMVKARGKPFDLSPAQAQPSESRGRQVDGVAIHSVRLSGFMAHQEVLLGGPGQILSIRHDTINRECYMPGVILAIREVVERPGLIFGLEALLGLQEG
jgi:4-hydroxy-tetrahydrodipicolinate reductase